MYLDISIRKAPGFLECLLLLRVVKPDALHVFLMDLGADGSRLFVGFCPDDAIDPQMTPQVNTPYFQRNLLEFLYLKRAKDPEVLVVMWRQGVMELIPQEVLFF